jgi:WD40 repeat protein
VTVDQTALVITDEQVAALGNVDDALAQFYVEQITSVAQRTGVPERAIRNWFEEELINEQGFRAQVLEGPPVDNGSRVPPLLVDAHLLRTESRRGAVWYELAHDRLIGPIVNDNARWREAHLSELQKSAARWGVDGRPDRLLLSGQDLAEAERWAKDHDTELIQLDNAFLDASREAERQQVLLARAARRKRRVAATVGAVAIAVMIAITYAVFQNRAQANQRRSERLASQSLAIVDANPDQAARLSLQAWQSAHTQLAQEAVRQANSAIDVERSLVGHRGAVNSVVVSPDGATILTASDDGTARSWDARTGAPKTTFAGHTAPVRGARFTPDSRSVVTWSDDNTVRTWDAATGRQIASSNFDSQWGVPIDLSPDGTLVAAASDPHHVTVSNVLTGKVVARIPLGNEFVTAVSFDGGDADVLFVGSYNQTEGAVRAWSVSGGTVINSLLSSPSEQFFVSTLATTRDGETVAVGTTGTEVLLWKWLTGDAADRVFLPEETQSPVAALSFDKSGTSLVASGEKVTTLFRDNGKNLGWDVVGTLKHDDFANRSAISPDGSLFASASRDGTAKVGDVRSGTLLADLHGHTADVTDVAILPDNRIVTASADGTARLWHLPASYALLGHNDWVLGLDVAGDGRTAVSAGHDGKVIVWDLQERKPITSVTKTYSNGAPLPMEGATIDRSGRSIATVDANGGVWIWKLESGELRPYVSDDAFRAVSVAFDPGGTRLAIGMDSGGVAIWNWQIPGPARIITTGSGAAVPAWSPDGREIAIGLSDGRITVWSPDSQRLLATLRGHVGQVWGVAFSPDGHLIASAGQDNTARIWDAKSGRELHVLGDNSRLSAVDFSPHGDVVATGDAGGFIGIWDVRDGVNLSLRKTHGEGVNALRVLPDGTVVSAGDDRAVRLSSCDSCVPMGQLVQRVRTLLKLVPTITSPPAERAPDLSAFVVGTCVATNTPGDAVRSVPIDCAKPHALELYASYNLPGTTSESFPGVTNLQNQAQALCSGDAFTSYVGVPVSRSRYNVLPRTPTSESWVTGLRRVLCFLSDRSGMSTGSAFGARK